MIWLMLLFLGIVAVAPFILEHKKPDMDDDVRAMVPGEFAQLSDGFTHFQWHGPKDGPVLVCVHGLTTPSFVWDELVPGLTEAGFRVLTYDLYGRGWSDRPDGAQTRSFFIRQLRDLLDHQGVNSDITVMGYSMGGSIATIFASEEPHRISRLILLAPAGLEHRPTPFAEFTRLSGYTGKWAMLAFGGYMLRRGAYDSPGPDGFADRQAAEIGWRGFLPAVLSSQRNLLSETTEEEHRSLARLNVSVAAIWGETDTVIPLSAMGKLTEWNRNARQVSVPDAGHAVTVTHPSEIIDALANVISN